MGKMHPHVEFFDRLAQRVDQSDPKLSRLLCGVRDQIHASSSSIAPSVIAMKSVKRTLQFILSNYQDREDLKVALTKFLDKVERKKSIL